MTECQKAGLQLAYDGVMSEGKTNISSFTRDCDSFNKFVNEN